jgi:hypothetical protein
MQQNKRVGCGRREILMQQSVFVLISLAEQCLFPYHTNTPSERAYVYIVTNYCLLLDRKCIGLYWAGFKNVILLKILPVIVRFRTYFYETKKVTQRGSAKSEFKLLVLSLFNKLSNLSQEI